MHRRILAHSQFGITKHLYAFFFDRLPGAVILLHKIPPTVFPKNAPQSKAIPHLTAELKLTGPPPPSIEPKHKIRK